MIEGGLHNFNRRLMSFGHAAWWVRAVDASGMVETSLHHGVLADEAENRPDLELHVNISQRKKKYCC